MRIIDFRLRRTHTILPKRFQTFFHRKITGSFVSFFVYRFFSVLLKHAMEIDARVRGKKWWTIVVEWQSAIGNMRILKSCEGTSKINEPKVNVSVVFFLLQLWSGFFLVFFKSLRIYCWFGDIIDWHPSPSQSPSEMWLLKCSSENWNATRKKENTHTHTHESGQMVIESGIQMRCSYQIVLCDLLASWGHFEQKHFGSMFSNATPSRSQNTL